MRRMKFRDEADCKLMTAAEFLVERFGDKAGLERFSEEALSTKMRIFEEGSDSSPQLFESQLLPNTEAAEHSHEEDEIVYVLDGEMRFGNRTLTKGSTVFIPANAPYQFKVGPEGARFLNFRPRRC